MRAPLVVQILSISCSFWDNLANLYVGAPPGELAPLPRGNPGSATAYYWLPLHLTNSSLIKNGITQLSKVWPSLWDQ